MMNKSENVASSSSSSKNNGQYSKNSSDLAGKQLTANSNGMNQQMSNLNQQMSALNLMQVDYDPFNDYTGYDKMILQVRCYDKIMIPQGLSEGAFVQIFKILWNNPV